MVWPAQRLPVSLVLPDVAAVASDEPTALSGPLAREALALGAFDHMVSHVNGFRSRPGQRDMAAHIASTLADVAWEDDAPEPAQQADWVPGAQEGPVRGIAVVQAGTGVGKSAAYAATVIPLALAQQKRVIISTATVALQEQLIAKDLPALSAALPHPFAFALAKGRGRYVCRLKLEQLASADPEGVDLFDADGLGAPEALTHEHRTQRREERGAVYERWCADLDAGHWDGDRDRLPDPPSTEWWLPVAAERHTCTARHCPAYHSCSYYQARARLAQAQVIVVNHDLLLSTLGLHALPAPDDCYVIFDEAHHLAGVAQGQFTTAMDWMRTQWLDRLPRVVDDVAAATQYPLGVDVAHLSKSIKSAQGELARMGMLRVAQQTAWAALLARAPRSGERREGSELPPSVIDRLDQGEVPSDWLPWLESLQADASALLKVFEGLAAQIKSQARDNPGDAPRLAQLYSRLGVLAPRLQSVEETARRWLEAPVGQQPPLAKWLEAQVHNGVVALSAHACPVQPGQLLRHHLWQRVRAAVVTSASLTTCGTFDHFLRESGLYGDPAVSTREVQSPFNHAEQGRLVVVQTQADPKDVEAYTQEMLTTLMLDLQRVARGALVLFTSRAQMKQALLMLEQGAHRDLRERVLVQGDASRTVVLQRHGERVAMGQASILFGLQSFGEGLDLPGELCEWVFITKLPFASPSDPVGQARADWVKAQGRDPFSELVVPATGARLLQWTGRALRTENDQAVVVCYDPRLLRQAYGRRMLQGLPPYRLQRRVHGQDVDVNL
ncbi:MAG: hypothetical protein RJB34_184 [Pseudomonadota bacterium]